jgi:transglutaminase-like putative cysteine protease
MAAEIAAEAKGDAQEFLPLVATCLRQRFRRISRAEGEAWAPEETIARGEGSCRDLTVLYMAIARAQGFACRFVTGYHALEGAREHDLHAWADVYVPGGGWRGFDAMHGLAVADRHVAVAFGPSPDLAMTVTGAYRGRAAQRLEAKVEVSEG